MPSNLCEIRDRFHLTGSHVLPALIRKFHAAMGSGKGEVAALGTGTPAREFLHVGDLANACPILMRH